MTTDGRLMLAFVRIEPGRQLGSHDASTRQMAAPDNVQCSNFDRAIKG